jgi:CHAD domain-containing protein
MVAAVRMGNVAMGDILAAPVLPTRASRVIAEYVSRHGDALRDAAGERDPLSLHAAVDRLRATLKTLRPLLARDRSDHLRVELHWLADALDAVRDNDVVTRRLADAVSAEPPGDIVGPITQRLGDALAAAGAEAQGRLAIALDAPRYAALLDSLAALAATVPRDIAGVAVVARTRAALRRADKHLARALQSSAAHRASTCDTEAAARDADSAYRRAGYAVELAEPLVRGPVRSLRRRLAAVHELLTDQRNAALTVELLRTYATAAAQAGEDGFTYGLLMGRQPTRIDGRVATAARHARRRTPDILR